MSPLARGALLLSLLPAWPRVSAATSIRAQLAKAGVDMTLRSVQRDLRALPASLVRTRGCLPTGWGRMPLRGEVAT